jgi:3-methyladenine DNA glycosylase AlkC
MGPWICVTPLHVRDLRSERSRNSMKMTDEYQAIAESTSDWEAGTARMPAARMDYTRVSQANRVEDGYADEANSDLGNLGRDVHDMAGAPYEWRQAS